MKTQKSTKRSLLGSVGIIALCLVMLLGTTFAWFTDTASTGVNQIQSGTLNVDIVDALGASLDGKTLKFRDVNNNDEILWEPGATFKTPSFKIVNKGNLALKYEVQLNGVKGDTGLLKVITFSIVDETAKKAVDLNAFTGQLNTKDAASNLYHIEGHMDDQATNDYQGLTLNGIGITVYATQAPYEADSIGTNYDAGAQFNKNSATIMLADGGATVTLEPGKTYTVGEATVTVDTYGNITYANETTNAQTVTITTDGNELTVNAPYDTIYHYGKSKFVNVQAVADKSYHAFGKVTVLSVTKGRAVIESGNNVAVTQVKGAEAIIAVPESTVLVTTLQKDAAVKEVKMQVGEQDFTVAANGTVTAGEGTEVSAPAELVNVAKAIENATTYVASVGDKMYTDLQKAFTEAEAGKDLVVELHSDININRQRVYIVSETNNNGLSTPVGAGVGDITILGNGHTVSSDSNNARVLAIEDSKTARTITIKDTKILAAAKIAASDWNTRGVALYGLSNTTVNLENCTIETAADNYAYAVKPIYCNNVTVNITNCTMNAANCIETNDGDGNTFNITDCKLNSNYKPNKQYCGNGIQDKDGHNNTFNIKNTTFSGEHAQPYQSALNSSSKFNDLGGIVDNTTRNFGN